MTFWAAKNADGKRADVHVTYGPISITVTEDPAHLGHFVREVDRLLADLGSKPAEVDSVS